MWVKKIFNKNNNWWVFFVLVICVFGELDVFCGRIVCFEVDILLE